MNVHYVLDEFQGSFTEDRSVTNFIVIHHAAALYPTHRGIDDVRSVANYHVKTRGWSGIGYHEALAEATPGGEVECFVLSDPESIRGHVYMRNGECFGICNLTNFGNDMPAEKWIHATAERVAVARRRWPKAQVVGHKEIALPSSPTACPGGAWAKWKPRLLQAIPVPPANRPAGWYSIVGGIDYAAVRTEPKVDASIAMGGLAKLAPGTLVHVDGFTNGFAHLSTKNEFGDLGFVHMSLLGNAVTSEPVHLDPVAPDYPIVGSPQVPPTVLDTAFQKFGPHVGQWERQLIVSAFTTYGELLGLGNLIPFAQAVHETDWFRSAAWRDHRNPAGIGKTSDDVPGTHFHGVGEGILAQYAHLMAYALKLGSGNRLQNHLMITDPRFEVMERGSLFGTAPRWSSLTGKWATDPNYWPKIAAWVDKIRAG